MSEIRYQRVHAALHSLALTTVPTHLDTLTQQAAADNWSALQFLDALTQTELAARTERDVQRHLRQAHLPFHKTLDEFD